MGPGYRMRAVVRHVAAHPGLPMIETARAIHPLPRAFSSSCAHGYNPIHRAIRAGLIARVPGPRRGTWLLIPVGMP